MLWSEAEGGWSQLSRVAWLGFSSTWGLQLRTVLAVIIPHQVSVGVLLLAGRVLQLGGESDAGAVEGRAVAGQTDLWFTCRKETWRLRKSVPIHPSSRLFCRSNMNYDWNRTLSFSFNWRWLHLEFNKNRSYNKTMSHHTGSETYLHAIISRCPTVWSLTTKEFIKPIARLYNRAYYIHGNLPSWTHHCSFSLNCNDFSELHKCPRY